MFHYAPRRAAWPLALASLVVKEFPPTIQGPSLYPWHASLPLLVLRLVSAKLDASPSLLATVEYALYAPLYVAGPIMTYADFAAAKAPSINRTSYILRTAIAGIFLEVGTRRYPAFALARTDGLAGLDGQAVAAFLLIAVNLLWLKFTVIWRLSRSLALIDGLDPPENMRRFVCDNFSISGFWRGWHASFNAWLRHYLYLPLGGNKRPVIATLAVFAFTVAWHDFSQPKLVAWGALNAACLLVERRLGLQRAARDAARTGLGRARVAASGALYITALIVANVVGYSVGLSGVADGIRGASFAAHRSHAKPAHALLAAVCVFTVFFADTQAALLVRRLEFLDDNPPRQHTT